MCAEVGRRAEILVYLLTVDSKYLLRFQSCLNCLLYLIGLSHHRLYV